MAQKRILIVEDDPLLSKMYQTKLSIEGFEARAAYDGEEGLKMVKGDPPNLILLDLMLPKMDGFSVLKELKKLPKIKDIPVIVFSNLAQASDIQLAKELGAADYIVKAHLTPNAVVEKIKEFIDNHNKR